MYGGTRHNRSLATLLGLALAAASVVVATAGGTASAAESSPSRFLPTAPCRLLDTRLSGGPVAANGTIDVAVTGDLCDVPDNANAAVLTVTVDKPAGFGFITAWPAGDPQPEASILNYGPKQSIANSQAIQIGDDGEISMFTLAKTDIVVDVTGYFVASGSVAAGRFVAVETHRLVDTTLTTRPAPDSAVRVHPDVPPDAVAVAVNITTTQSLGPGFFTAYPAGTTRPVASVLDTDRAKQTRAAATIVPINADGFDVYTLTGDHVIVDITGYFTGPSETPGTAGRFVSTVPQRLVDTRLTAGVSGGPRLWDHGARQFAVDGITGGPVAAVAANVTLTTTEDPGYVTAGPARVARPLTSTVNADAAQRTVANSAIVEASTQGIQFTTLEATHLVVDITGWFTGTPIATDSAAPTNTAPGDRKVTIIADSAIAGIRWNGALAGLQGFVVDQRLESCRRLVQASCRGREGYTPRTTVNEIKTLTNVGPEDILVIGSGYDDWSGRFNSDFDVVVATARAQGFHHIAWLTYRSNVNYTMPTGLRSNYAAMNVVLRTKVESGDFQEVRIWDWDAYTIGVANWFYTDGIHLRPTGGWGAADWISRHVRAFDDRPCAQPNRPGETVPDPCPNPDTLPSTTGYPDIAGLYNL